MTITEQLIFSIGALLVIICSMVIGTIIIKYQYRKARINNRRCKDETYSKNRKV
jgi:NhaP-type Na+/H+ or K+/H+ antiporter